jgi:oligopeptide transport system substrate-binding protein
MASRPEAEERLHGQAEAALDYLIMNTTKPPLDNPKVRKAFNLSIDKEAYANWRQIIKPLTTFMPEGMFPGYPQPKGPGFNPAEARRLLGDGGLSGHTELGRHLFMSEVSGGPGRVYLQHPVSNKSVAEWMQAQWKQNLWHHCRPQKHGVEDLSGSAR